MKTTNFKTTMFRTLVMSLIFMIILIFRQYHVYAVASATVVKVDPNMNSANVGETFTINITVTEVQNLYGIEETLDWNSSVLNAVSIDVRIGQTGGALYNSVFIIQNSSTPGKYSLAATSVNPAPSFNGTGTIATIAFQVTGQGNSTLNLTSKLYDYPPTNREPRVSMPIDHTVVNGLFEQVIPEMPNQPLLALLLLFAASATALSRKKRTKHLTKQQLT